MAAMITARYRRSFVASTLQVFTENGRNGRHHQGHMLTQSIKIDAGA